MSCVSFETKQSPVQEDSNTVYGSPTIFRCFGGEISQGSANLTVKVWGKPNLVINKHEKLFSDQLVVYVEDV